MKNCDGGQHCGHISPRIFKKKQHTDAKTGILLLGCCGCQDCRDAFGLSCHTTDMAAMLLLNRSMHWQLKI